MTDQTIFEFCICILVRSTTQSHPVLSRWSLKQGVCLVQTNHEVKAVSSCNDVFKFDLKDNDMIHINLMDRGFRSDALPEFKDHRFYPYRAELKRNLANGVMSVVDESGPKEELTDSILKLGFSEKTPAGKADRRSGSVRRASSIVAAS